MRPTGHVLLYTDEGGGGGLAQYNHAILLALARQGHAVTCVRPHADNPLVRAEADAGVRHHWLDFDPGRDPARTLDNPDDARRVFAQLRPDLVLFSNSWPLSNLAARAAAIGAGLPFVIVENFADIRLARRFAGRLDELARHYAAARAVVCVSHENHALLCRQYRLPVGKGQVIYYGRPDRYFRPPDTGVRDRLRAAAGVPLDAVLCLTAARLDPIKGYHVQLAAIDRLRQDPAWPRLAFAWAGEGSQAAAIAEAVHAQGVGDRVKLLGQRWDVDEWLDAADVFVLPSLGEGMPLAVMEAMAKGLPVVASAVSGIPEELGPTGRLLPDPRLDPRGAVAELARTLAAWAADADLRRRVGEACRERAMAMFREERMVRQTLAVIDRALLPEGDYVSPGLEVVRPDPCFPHMAAADPADHPWPYLRRHVPHTWYVDRRWPTIGWLSRDEAALLYNTARLFAGKPALEVGCFCGWSTCHLALAGVLLDVIDPFLARPDIAGTVRESLHAAGVAERVRLTAGESPAAVEGLARRSGRRWSLFFVDGDHGGDAPQRDVEACAEYAAHDAMILFHDLAAPDVARGLGYLRERGWRVLVYQTMQVMGVAWRGAVEPVRHRPDPAVAWSLPEHLRDFPVSGCPDPVIAGRDGCGE
jgi:glycosyltransferase involved in cell wall biosynthesis